MAVGIVEFLVKMNSKNAQNNTRALKEEIDTAGNSSEELEVKLSAVDAIKLSAVTSATNALTSAMGEAVKEAGNYSYEFARVNMLTGANAEEAAKLERQMLDLGSQTTLTTTEVAKAAQELGALGFNAEDTSRALSGVVKAAEGTGASAEDVAKTMAAVEKQFGLTADSSEHLADVLTVAANDSAADITYMADAFKYAGKDASSLGMSVEETAAVIMVLADNGLAASQAGTGLRAVIKNITAPTDAATSALNDLNVEIYDAEGGFRGFSTVVGELSKAFSELNDEERNNYARAIAGKTASAAFLTVLEGGSGTIEEYQRSLENSTGAANEASSVLRDTLTAQFNSLFGSITNVVYALLGLLEPAIVILIKGITTLLGWVQDVIFSFRDWIYESKLVSTAMLWIAENSDLVSKAIAIIIASTLIYIGVQALLTSEIWLSIAARTSEIALMIIENIQILENNIVVGIQIALKTIFNIKTYESIAAKIAEITQTIVSNVYEGIANALRILGNFLISLRIAFLLLWASGQTLLNASIFIYLTVSKLSLVQIIKSIAVTIKKIATIVINTIVQIALNVAMYAGIAIIILMVAALIYLIVTHDGLKKIVLIVLGVFFALFQFFVQKILPVLLKLAQFIIQKVIPAIAELIKIVAEKLLPILSQLWEFFATYILPILQQLATLIMTIVVPALKAIWDIISPLLIPILEALSTLIVGTLVVALDLLNAALEILLPPIESLCTWIGEKLTAAINAVKPALNWLGDKFSWIADIVSGLASGIGGVVDSIGGFFGIGGQSIQVQRTGAAFDDTQTIAYRNMSGFGQIQGSGLGVVNNDNSMSISDSRQYQIVVNSVEEANEVIDAHKEWKEMIKG